MQVKKTNTMRLFLIFGMIVSMNVYGQNDSCILIKSPKHKITFFQSEYKIINDTSEVFYCFESVYGKSGNSKPWTPTKEQIKALDENIKKLIVDYKSGLRIDKSKLNYYNNINNIVQNIDNYNRQYFCCLNNQRVKIIFIDFKIKSEDDNLDIPDNPLIGVDGGGSNYFNVIYNFDSKKIISLDINDDL